MFDSRELMAKLCDWKAPVGSSAIILTFEEPDSASVDSRIAALRHAPYDAVVTKEPWDAFWGQRYASVLDPDGNQIDVWSWLPGKRPGATNEASTDSVLNPADKKHRSEEDSALNP